MKYKVSYIKSDGRIVIDQIYTSDRISGLLQDLENWKAHDIVIRSFDDNEDREIAKRRIEKRDYQGTVMGRKRRRRLLQQRNILQHDSKGGTDRVSGADEGKL